MTETRHDLGVHGVRGVHRMLDRWAHAGLIDEAQAERIESFEEERQASTNRPSLVVEATAYLGGALTLAAVLLLVQLVWGDLSTGARLAIPAAASAALLGGGTAVPATTAGARRLRSALWLLGTASWAAALAVLADQVLGLSGQDTVLIVGLGAAAVAVPLYVRTTDALQQLAVLASLAVSAGALGARADRDEPTLIGLGIWLVAAAWAVAGELGYLPPSRVARSASSVALVGGTLPMVSSGGGQVAGAATIAWLLTLGLRRGSVGVLAVAALATVLLVPQSVQYFFPDDTHVAVPVTLLAVGAALVVLAVTVSRRQH